MTAPKITIDLAAEGHGQYISQTDIVLAACLPIHGRPIRIRCTREELENPGDEEKGYGYDVDGIACFSKAKPRWRERFTADTLLKDAYPVFRIVMCTSAVKLTYMLCRSCSCSRGRS